MQISVLKDVGISDIFFMRWIFYWYYIYSCIEIDCTVWTWQGLYLISYIYCRLNKNIKAASEVDYPAYGVTGPTKERLGSGPGDRKLAQSAQMYHYQHQKQQMIAMEK